MSKKNDPVVVAYEEYKQQCAGLSIAPCDFVGWQIYAVQLDEHHLPYLTNYGAVWARDLRKKTGRADRPAIFFIRSDVGL